MPEYPVGPKRSIYGADDAEWFATTRAEALTVPCTHCRQPIGELCMNQGWPLKRFPAHTVRIEAAKRRSA